MTDGDIVNLFCFRINLASVWCVENGHVEIKSKCSQPFDFHSKKDNKMLCIRTAITELARLLRNQELLRGVNRGMQIRRSLTLFRQISRFANIYHIRKQNCRSLKVNW